jgi:hypothetical protein
MTFTETRWITRPLTRVRIAHNATQMYLARIEPERPGHDLRTFECPRCQHVETAVVKFK